MKKLSFIILSFLFMTVSTFGQEDPAKALKKATRALGSYNLSPADNGDKLDEAVKMIDIASADATVGAQVKTLQTKGEIYGTLLQNDINMLVASEDSPLENPKAGLMALDAYTKALEKAEKKYEKKDALTGLTSVGKNLNFIANAQINAKDYAGAFESLSAVLGAVDVAKANGGESPVADEEIGNQKYITAFCADAAGKTAEATGIFKDLYESGYDDPGVYAKYFSILSAEGKSDDALKVLEAGREKFPDDSEILFTEINYYIQKEEYDVLEKKLKEAVAKEPNNPSIYSALGNVYMNLYTEEYAANGETEKAAGYFNNSLEYFEKSIGIDANGVDAVYSIGSLYFNKAVEIIKAMNNLGTSKDDMKKYDALKVESDELFDKSLPYFKKAESLDPNDTNTLIALSEIFARTQDFEKSKEFKSRLQVVQGGGKNDASYFKE